MKIYISKTKNVMYGKPINQEIISEYICLNPKYKIKLINPDVKILMDSGAFQDRESDNRISFEEALSRQLKMEKETGITVSKIVAYDFIDDLEKTIDANIWLSERREDLIPRQIVLMIQGKDELKYKDCLMQTLKLVKSCDCIGFGGVSRAGINKKIKTKLLNTLKSGLPFILLSNIRSLHFFGIGTISVLREIKQIINEFERNNNISDFFDLSCDSSSFERNSLVGSILSKVTEKWVKTYDLSQKGDCMSENKYHPCDLTQLNIRRSIDIIKNI